MRPAAVAVDPEGNLSVSKGSCPGIRRVDGSDETISRFLETGV